MLVVPVEGSRERADGMGIGKEGSSWWISAGRSAGYWQLCKLCKAHCSWAWQRSEVGSRMIHGHGQEFNHHGVRWPILNLGGVGFILKGG